MVFDESKIHELVVLDFFADRRVTIWIYQNSRVRVIAVKLEELG